jgi:hypothetical protein
VILAWAHGPGNAAKGMIEDPEAGRIITDDRWGLVGVGVADASWFNGRIYVVIFVDTGDANVEEADDASASAVEEAGSDDLLGDTSGTGDTDVPDTSGTTTAPGSETPEDPCENPVDLDGDGQPDDQSVDPSQCDEQPTG